MLSFLTCELWLRNCKIDLLIFFLEVWFDSETQGNETSLCFFIHFDFVTIVLNSRSCSCKTITGRKTLTLLSAGNVSAAKHE